MASLGDNYWIGWLHYNRREDGCLTHAGENGKQRTLCGVTPTEGDGATLTEFGGQVGCKRCSRILNKRGVLPLAVKQVSDRRGNLTYVAVK